MTSLAESPDSGTLTASATPPESDGAVQDTLGDDTVTVGLVVRIVSWGIDELLINMVAIFTGVGIALVVAIFPITRNLHTLFVAVAGTAYVLWTAAYFVIFWSITGQTPGARVMQVRLVTPSGGKVKPVRAVLRWIAMNVALFPLPWGFLPIPFKRKGFPDWLAHTRVIEAPQMSIAAQRRAKNAETRKNSRATAAAGKAGDSQP